MANEKKDNGSFLRAAAVAAPLGIGGGVVIRKMMREGKIEFAPKTPAIFDAIHTAQSFVAPGVNDQWKDQLQWLENPELASELRTTQAEAARHAWTQAMRFTDKKASASMLDFTAGLSTMEGNSVYDAILQTVRQNQSQAMLSTFRRFKSNLGAVSEHLAVMGGVAPNITDALYQGSISNQIDISQLPSEIEKQLQAMAPDMFISGDIKRYVRPEFAGFESYMLHLSGPSGHDIDLLLPMSKEGVLLEGTSMRTRYIAPDIAIYDPEAKQITKRMSRSEFFMEEFRRTILPAVKSGRIKTQADVDKAVRQLRDQVFHELETVTNVPDTVEAAALRRYQHIKGQAVDIKILKTQPEEVPREYLYRSSFRDPTETELAHAIRGGIPTPEGTRASLYGGVSPKNLATGRVSTFNWAEMHMTPQAVDWGRRPEQLQRLFSLSPEAVKASADANRYRVFETSRMKRLWGMEGLPAHMRTMYLDPSQHVEAMRAVGIGEGEALASATLQPMLEQQATKHVHLVNMDNLAKEMIAAGRANEFKPGQIIGWDTAGKAFTAADIGQQKIVGMTANQSKSVGDFYTLQLLDTYRMGEHEKFFGDLKATLRFTQSGEFHSALSKFNVDHGFEIIASMDDLRKNTAAHNKQMVTALWDVIDQNFAKAGVPPPVTSELGKFYQSPTAFASKWSSAAMGEGVYNHEKFIRQAMEFATKEADVSPEEFGTIFGAVPTVLDDKAKAAQLAKEAFEKAGMPMHELTRGEPGGGPMSLGMSDEAARIFNTNNRIAMSIEEMGKGKAGGAAQLFYDQPSFGGMGSVEPRAFEQLRSGATGELGTEFAEDIAKRLRVTQPEAFATHDALMKSLRTMVGDEKTPSGARIWDLEKQGYKRPEFQQWIEEGGGYLKFSKGFSDVYVPGSDTLQAMRPYQTAGGDRIKGYLADVYHQLAARGSRMHLPFGGIGPDAMRDIRNIATSQLAEHAAPAGKGMGGYMRGPVLGSQYLRNVTKIGRYQSKNVNEVGVHISRIRQMVDELMETGLYDHGELGGMLKRAQAGEAIGGWVARQPQIGAYSNQPVMIRPVFGEPTTAIATPEFTTNVTFRRGGGQTPITKQISFGPNVGMAGDKDADALALYLVGPKSEQRIAKTLANEDNEYMNRYMQHQMRLGLFKAKKAGSVSNLLSIEEKMIADARKLGTTQRFVPRLSVSLSEARQAVLAHAEGRQLADSQFLLEWMEQVPISAKHIGARDIAENKLTEMLEGLSTGLRTKDAGILQAQVQKVIAGSEGAAAMLSDELFVQNTAQISKLIGTPVREKLATIDLPEITGVIANSMRKYAESGAKDAAELLAGRQRVNAKTITPFLKAATQAGEGFSGVSKAISASENFIAAAGRGVVKHYKPLALGFAAALGVASVLSTPSDTIGPGKNLKSDPPDMNGSKAADRMTNVHPPSPSVGQPTAPGMMHQNSATIAPPRNENLQVRARMSSGMSANQFAGQLNRMTGGAKSVNVSVRDRRSSANQYIVANKMFR
jgi:hypothetical protein